MNQPTITDATRITILTHALNGHNEGFIAAATGTTEGDVRRVVNKAGFPDDDQMRRTLNAIRKVQDAIPTGQTEADRAARTNPPARPAWASHPKTPAASPPPSTGPARQDHTPQGEDGAPSRPPSVEVEQTHPPRPAGQLEQLLEAAEKSDRKRTRALAARIRAEADDLCSRLADEEQARVDKERARRARERAREIQEKKEAEKRRQIAELQEQIAQLRGELKNPSGGAKHGDYPCPLEDCPRVFDTAQGVALHKRKAHGDTTRRGDAA